ncbi:MAG: hybrid sensor histidine kinase/response regulator [Massilia sp.]|nr:hybrid sensor histidine kinase/response regulator [Massilia sp.]
MRAHDWSRSPIGPPAYWPTSLASMVGMILNSKFPMFVLWGPEYVMLYNDSYLPVLGERHGHALGRPMPAVWPEVWPDIAPIVTRAYDGEASFFDNLPVTLERNGFPEQAWFMFSYSPLRDEQGAVGGAICVCSETTQQVMEKTSLHRSEARWRALFENMQEGFFVGEAMRDEAGRMVDFRFIEVNPAFGGQTGLDPAKTIGRSAREAIPGLQQSLIDTYAAVVDTGEPNDFEVHVAPLGRTFEARARRQSPQRFSVLFLEVTARVAADKALRASEQRFRTLAQAMPDQMWTAGADGKLNWFNDRVFTYSGFGFAQLVGDGWGRIVHPDDLPGALRDWAAALASGDPYESNFRLRRADGAYRWFRARGLPVPDDSGGNGSGNGGGNLWVGINTDTQDQYDANDALQRMNDTLELRVAERSAELEAAHSALRQSQKLEAIGKLTGGVAHDFNNVLQVIGGNLQLLRPFVGDAAGRARLDGAIAGVARGAKLSSQLLAFARKQPLEPVVINPGALIRELGDMLLRTTGEQVDLETRIAADLWNTLIDPHQLENSLLNLVINARDAMDGAGRLTIEAGNTVLGEQDARGHPGASAGQYVMLAVTDSGSGMTEEVMQNAVEPFFTTKPEGHGTGLGLSMVYGFVTQSGGHMEIDSTVGVGTTVRIYLPRSMAAPEAAALPAPVDAVGGSETILVVEDDQQVRAIVVALLTDLGYRVLEAAEAQAALAIIETGVAVDLLFTDVVMPGELRSTELARRAKLAQPHLEVLFTSGYTEFGIVHDGRLERGVALLSKPYSREDLARKIRHLFANRDHLLSLTAPAVEAAPAAPLSILLVEDNADMRDMTGEVLRALGYQVEAAGSAEEALALLERSSHNVLITDVGLPGMSGYQLAERARAMGIGAVLFASGYGAGSDLPAGSFWLQKPFSVEHIQRALATIAAWRN